ncbi:phosphoribosyltransferase [Vampirovibrio sp.]|uniref:phosphoribosyltransferase n=1 Tax=Vampirovibrio sp. TaxID=2717857 RepID=UPI0035948466
MVFRNRTDAGKQLTEALLPYQRENCIILALPRGGVAVGHEVAKRLKKPLDVMVVRKIGAPGHEELAAGAIGPHDVLVLNRDVLVMLRLQPEALQDRIEQEKKELNRRLHLFRGDSPFPDLDGTTVILVDDGLATGATARAAIKAVKALKPAKIVLAIPVGTRPLLAQLRYEVDELVCLESPEHFDAVSAWYLEFPQCSDSEVIHWLNDLWDPKKEPVGMNWEDLPL